MLRLKEIKRDVAVNGNKPAQIVRIVTIEFVGENALMVYYQTAEGLVKEQRLSRSNESALSLAKEGRSWLFEAPDEFNLAVEVYRVNLAHLFEPMIPVCTSNVDPLPHQIVAAYESKHTGKALWDVPNNREHLMRAAINVAQVI